MDILAEIKHRPPCHIDMDGVRPAMPGHPYIVLLDEQERDNLVAEIDRLRAALRKHGSHAFGCYEDDNKESCDCGWNQLRNELNEQLTPEEISRTIPQIGEKR